MDKDDRRNIASETSIAVLQPRVDPLAERRAAEALAGKVCAAAAIAAQASARMLDLLGEFDAVDGSRHYDGCGSTARWLAWACSMSPGTAREHVRIARALRRMPDLAGLFRAARVSYSKVRAATRLVGVVDEAGLCELAVTMTAAQLDQTVSAYRASSGSRMPQQDRRRVSWSQWAYASTSVDADHAGDDADGVESQMVCITARLPIEEAAVVIAAIESARDRQPMGERDTADALIEVARDFLAAEPVDESGEDRTMVVVQVGVETLLDGTNTPVDGTNTPATGGQSSARAGTSPDVPAGWADVPAGASGNASVHGRAGDSVGCRDDGDYSSATPRVGDDQAKAGTNWQERRRQAVPMAAPRNDTPTAAPPAPDLAAAMQGGVPVGAPDGSVQAGLRTGVCTIPGIGPIEPATAAKLACDATVLGAIVDRDGTVLALGRSRRLVSKAQRRALMVRDRMCRFPGCHRTRHLQAHHVIAWAQGGSTDLDNLVLLCQRHHTYVHEGGLRLTRVPHGWQFRLPDGRDVNEILTARCATDDDLARYLADHAQRAEATLADVTGPDDEAARPLRPGWAGEPFSLYACVDALFGLADIRHRAEERAAA